MVQANELRIGNRVLYNDAIAEIRTITEIDVACKFQLTGAAAFGKFSFEEIRPIRLTPELLEACGFYLDGAKRYGGWLSQGETRLRIYQRGDSFYYCQDDSRFRDESNVAAISVPLHCLHQLQNLYFTLTETELSINLEKVKV